MALTNYIMQSLIGVIIFTSTGFKRYETLSPTHDKVPEIGVRPGWPSPTVGEGS